MKKIGLFSMIICIALSNVACGNKYQTNDTGDNDMQVVESNETTQPETVEEMKPLDYESCQQLKGTIDMMVIYNFSYSNLSDTPDDDFWNTFANALLCNSWYDGFSYLSDEFGTTTWSNAQVAQAGNILTGKELNCDSFPEGLNTSNASSPYAFNWEQKNILVENLESERWEVSFDFIWTSSSMDTKEGKKEVTAVIIPNEDSQMDGYSIESIRIKRICDPEYEQ